MIMVQKLSLAAFAIHDGELDSGYLHCLLYILSATGMGGNSRPLNKDQEKQKLT